LTLDEYAVRYKKFIGKTKMNAAGLKKDSTSPTHLGMLTPDQLRAARAMLGWSREDLAEKAGVSAGTVTGFELLGADSKISTLHKLRRALEVAGIEFIDEGAASPGGGPGLRLRGAKGKR
jgi:ribosome-binding protein aMBF1 (putative translation factor)